MSLPDRCVEVHTDPASGHESGYATRTLLREGDVIRLVIDGHERGRLAVDAILP